MDDAQGNTTDGNTGKDMTNNLKSDQGGRHLNNASGRGPNSCHAESCCSHVTKDRDEPELDKCQCDGVPELVHDLLTNVVGHC